MRPPDAATCPLCPYAEAIEAAPVARGRGTGDTWGITGANGTMGTMGTPTVCAGICEALTSSAIQMGRPPTSRSRSTLMAAAAWEGTWKLQWPIPLDCPSFPVKMVSSVTIPTSEKSICSCSSPTSKGTLLKKTFELVVGTVGAAPPRSSSGLRLWVETHNFLSPTSTSRNICTARWTDSGSRKVTTPIPRDSPFFRKSCRFATSPAVLKISRRCSSDVL
mmetsp:Transcript_20987/g.35018  ORF Transcript_20987/g.35018 Transcript_20987/m.35018 type:complete len:220 (-) Transcript_20987:83-742(-)